MAAGRINSIQTLGTVDGPGVRFVVFMQGCPLRCAYCHNPDTWDVKGGREMTAEEVFKRLCRYTSYFGNDGGITVSGGEPLLQARFVRELFALCKGVKIHTAIDTSGCLFNEDAAELLKVTDLCLLDDKMADDDMYRSLIGCPRSAPERFLSELEARGIDTWLRRVIVTDVNDSAESVRSLFDTARAHKCVKRVELLKFRKLCAPKYENLGIPFPFGDKPQTTPEQIEALWSAAGDERYR